MRKRGQRLAHLLDQFIEAEVEDPGDRARVRLAVHDYFEQNTNMHRPDNPWPVDDPDDEPSPN